MQVVLEIRPKDAARFKRWLDEVYDSQVSSLMPDGVGIVVDEIDTKFSRAIVSQLGVKKIV